MKYSLLPLVLMLVCSDVAAATIAPFVIPKPTHKYSAPLIANQFPFDENEMKKFDQSGTASLDGEAFLAGEAGAKTPLSGKTIYLIPQTKYTQNMYLQEHYFTSSYPNDSRMAKHVLKTTSDADGKFHFTDLPAGAYFLEISLPQSGFRRPQNNTPSVITQSVTVGEGEKAVTTLSH